MKKAQILSAIALAFALGLTVVAPVANVSAFTVADSTAKPAVKGSATQAEVETAVAAVSGTYKAYDNMVALYDLLHDADVTGADLAMGDNDYPTVYNSVVEAFNTFGIADVNTAINKANADTKLSFVGKFDAIKGLTAKVDHYDAIAALVNALANKNDAELRDAIYGINVEYGLTGNSAIDYDNDVTYASYTADGSAVKAKVDGVIGSAYDNVESLANAIAAAQKAFTAYTNAVTKLNVAYKAEGVMTTAGLTNLATKMKDINVAIADLTALANTAANMNGYAAWVGNDANSVRAAIKNANDNKIDVDSERNYDLVITLATALKAAVPMPSQTPAQIAQTLVGYVAPETPDDTTTTTIESADGSVSVKGELQAGLVVEAKEAEEKDEMFKKAFGDKKFFVYDIKIKGQNGYVTTFDKDVTVTVKVPENINGAKAGIYYINDEGSASKIASTYNAEAKTLTFTTNHFSYYAIVEDNGVNVSDSGVLAAADGTASSTVAIVAGIATALTAAGAGVVAYRNARRASKEA